MMGMLTRLWEVGGQRGAVPRLRSHGKFAAQPRTGASLDYTDYIILEEAGLDRQRDK